MKIQLKEKHLCYVINHLSTMVLSEYFKLVSEIKDKLSQAEYQPDDMVEINVTIDDLTKVYVQLGFKPEYLVKSINEEMKGLLTAQLTQKYISYMTLLNGRPSLTEEELQGLTSDELAVVIEAGEVANFNQQISAREADADAQIESMITNGRNLIK